jgi:hypothetical protein
LARSIESMPYLLALLLFAFSAPHMLAAGSEVTGVVLDPSGAAVSGAKVTLRQPSGPPLTASTDLAGTFRFTGLADGAYELLVEREGFAPLQTRVKAAAKPSPLRIVLRIATLRQEMMVRNPLAEVTTEPGENMDVVRLDRKTLDKLPVLGNDIVGAAAQFLDAGALGAGGISLVVDGMETTRIGVSASAIQEVRINQNPYSAEYARPGRGRIEIITKAGTDKYHGAAQFLFRDYRLDARNAFAETRPPEQRRIFEGSLTGPLGHAKKASFVFSGNHEEEDLQSVVFARTPSGIVQENAGNPQRQTEFSFKVTRQFSPRYTLSVRYEFGTDSARGESVGGFTLPEAGFDAGETEHHVYYNHRAIFTPHLTNDFSLRFGRNYAYRRSRLPGARQIAVLDAFTGGGAQADQHSTENHVQFTDMASWSHRKHLVKFGISVPDINRRGSNDHGNFDGTFYFSSIEDYLAGKPFSFTQQQGNGYLVIWQREMGLFVQDDFKLRPNLSVALGLRCDWQNYLADHNNFAPRLSVAYSPDKARKTVLRAGAGIFYDRTGPGAIADTVRFDGQHFRSIVITNPGYPDPLAGSGTLATQPSNVTRFAPNLREPYTLQYNFGVERQLRKALVATANYTGLTGVKLFRSRDINAPLPPLYPARPLPGIGILREIESAGRLQSHSLDLGLRGTLTKFLEATVQYGLGRARNNTGGIGSFPANNYDLSGEWARANFDVRHRFRFLGTFKAGDWFEFGTIVALSSGAPFTITTGRDGNNDGRANDRPLGVARNTRQGYGVANVDLRLSREFKLTRSEEDEAPSMAVNLDAFNVLNRVNYTGVVGNLSSPFFGQPVSSRPARRTQVQIEFKF